MSSFDFAHDDQLELNMNIHDTDGHDGPCMDIQPIKFDAPSGNNGLFQPFVLDFLKMADNNGGDLQVAHAGPISQHAAAPQLALGVQGAASIRARAAAAAAALTQTFKVSPSSSLSSSDSGDNESRSKNETNKESETAQKDDDTTTLTSVHRACQQFPTNCFVIKTAMGFEPAAIRKKMTIAASSKKADRVTLRNRFVVFPQRRKQQKTGANAWFAKEPFNFPVNIALHNGTNLDALLLLVYAAPDVLTEQDGPDRLCTLSLTLMTMGQDERAVDLVLTANPGAVVIPDRRQNLPLHIACQKGAPLEVVRQLHCLYPQAAKARNFHGETPSDIARRNCKCPDAVLDFLQGTW